jgi:hypothetical protein
MTRNSVPEKAPSPASREGRHDQNAFGWLMPGEVKVFETDELDEAKEWLVRPDDDDDD